MSRIRAAVSDFFSHFSVFRRVAPVDSVSSFTDFLVTRPAFVSQKKLFEYCKQRMGTSFPRHFKEDVFIDSLNIAKWHVYAAAMSDLGVWMAAQMADGSLDAADARALAAKAHADALAERFDPSQFTGDLSAVAKAFEDRLALSDFAAIRASGDSAFSRSPKDLVKWAPIAPELKKYDVEIVENSIRFAWVAIREEFHRIANKKAIAEEWRSRQ